MQLLAVCYQLLFYQIGFLVLLETAATLLLACKLAVVFATELSGFLLSCWPEGVLRCSL